MVNGCQLLIAIKKLRVSQMSKDNQRATGEIHRMLWSRPRGSLPPNVPTYGSMRGHNMTVNKLAYQSTDMDYQLLKETKASMQFNVYVSTK